jgi:ankyrin repeat protein
MRRRSPLAWLAGPLLTLSAAAVAQTAMPPLVDAARRDDAAAALALIAGGADVNQPSSDGTTALHWAVHHGDVALIDRLLAAHAHAAVANDYGASPLSEAAVFGDTAVIERLLKAGADAESPNADAQTALMIIARTSNVAAARLLIGHGANVNAVEKWRGQTALHWAAAQSQPAMVKELLRHHANPNARSMINEGLRQVTSEPRVQVRPRGGFTPLLYAARQGCLECVKYLLEGGADIDLTDPDGMTPLLMAIESFHFDVGAWLIRKGADVNRWDWWGRTPLYAAVDLNTLPYGGRPDHLSLDETTSLKAIELLLAAGANPNAQLKLFPPYRALGADRGGDSLLTIGTTPLLRAARAGDAAAIRLLLAHGAKPDLGNNTDVTPLMAAAGIGATGVDTRGKYKTQAQSVESIDLLIGGGAEVNAINARGQTALHGAALFGWNDVVKCLASHHAKLDVKDARGMTPIDTALGKAGGPGRGAQSGTVHQDTATLLQQLITGSTTASTSPVAPQDRPL